MTDARPRYRYVAVAGALRADIGRGVYPPGASLPSRARLARDHQVSEIVVRAALRLLHAEGLIETRSGRATRVIAPSPDAAETSVSGAPAADDATVAALRCRVAELENEVTALQARTR